MAGRMGPNLHTGACVEFRDAGGVPAKARTHAHGHPHVLRRTAVSFVVLRVFGIALSLDTSQWILVRDSLFCAAVFRRA